MKRKLAVAMTGVMAASMLSAFVSCAEEKTPITVWMGSWWEEEIPRIEEGFEEAYPEYDLQVSCLPINGYSDSAVTAILGGNAPDVLALDTLMLGTPIGQGLLQPLDDFMAEYEWSKEDFSEGVMMAGVVDDVTYAVPYRTGPAVMFYNKTLFDEAGVEYPTNDMDYDTFLEKCIALTDTEKGIYGFGIAGSKNDPANVITSLSPFLATNGASLLTEDNSAANTSSPEFVTAVKQWAELYTVHKVVPEGCINYAFSADLRPMACNGTLAMCPMDPSTASKMDGYAEENGFEYGYVTREGTGDRAGGWHFTIPVGAKNVEGAKAFMNYFLTPEILADQNIVQPGVKACQEMGAWASELYSVYWEQDAKCNFIMPIVPQYNQIQDIVIGELQNILQETVTIEEGCAAMAEKIDAIL